MEHIKKYNAQWMINEHNKFLNDSTRKSMINLVVDFMVKCFGLYPSKFQKNAIAKAIIQIFPSMRYRNSQIGGIVSKNRFIFLIFCHFK